MRKFAYSFIACVASIFVAQSFAQPRDLFAEFEAEAEAAQSSAAVAPSSASVPSSSSVAAKSAPAVKPAPASSSSAKVSSSSVAPVSSSVVVSSSSEAPAPAPVDSAAAVAEAPADVDSAFVDSLAGDSVREMTPEEAYAAEMKRHNEENHIRDSLAMAAASSSATEAPSSSSMSRRELLGPVKVSKVNGIDEMKGRYKNPRKALFMSLVIPGAGQMYVGGSNFTYIRGGVYLALEATLWGSWYYFSVNKYNKQVKRYKNYAKEHYSIGRYEQRMRSLYNADAVNYESEFRRRYLGSRETFCEGIFGVATTDRCYDRDKLYSGDVEYVNTFVKSPKSLGNEMKKVDFDNASEVYQLIADDAYVLGWEDIGDEDVAVATSLALDDPNHATEPLSKSESDYQKEYRSMRGKANDYADMQAWFFGGLILNHIISAVDAAFSANAHNKALYEEDLSWYDHLRFDSGLSFVKGFGFNVQASWGF